MKNSRTIEKVNTKNASITLEVIQNVTSFEDYKILEFNRGVSSTNVKEITSSFTEFGTGMAVIKVLKTKAITGKYELFVVDGQHTIQSAIKSGLPVIVIIGQLLNDSLLNIVTYVSVLNNRRKSWSNQNFLSAFKGVGVDEYEIFSNLIKDEKLTVTDLLTIFLGGAGALENKMYKNGTMKFNDMTESINLLNALKQVRNIIPTKSFARRSFYKVIRTTKNYDKFVKDIIKANIKFSENELDFYEELVQIRDKKTLKVA